MWDNRVAIDAKMKREKGMHNLYNNAHHGTIRIAT